MTKKVWCFSHVIICINIMAHLRIMSDNNTTVSTESPSTESVEGSQDGPIWTPPLCAQENKNTKRVYLKRRTVTIHRLTRRYPELKDNAWMCKDSFRDEGFIQRIIESFNENNIIWGKDNIKAYRADIPLTRALSRAKRVAKIASQSQLLDVCVSKDFIIPLLLELSPGKGLSASHMSPLSDVFVIIPLTSDIELCVKNQDTKKKIDVYLKKGYGFILKNNTGYWTYEIPRRKYLLKSGNPREKCMIMSFACMR